MHTFGGSVVVAVASDILKIHVHTDTPEAVFSYAARWGRVETTKADDMRAQHRRLAHPERRRRGDRHRHVRRPVRRGARPPPDRAGAAAGGLRRCHLPGPGGAQAGGVLPPAARGAGAPDDFPARSSRVRQGASRRPGRGGRGGGGAAGGRAVGHLRQRPGRGAGGGHQRRARGGQPLGLARRGDAGAPRGRAGGSRLGRPGDRGGARAGPWPVGNAADGGYATTTCCVRAGCRAARRGSPGCWT